MNKKLLLIIILIGLNSCAQVKKSELNYKIITTDIDNFWNAYDALEGSQDSIQTFQNLYIDKASPEFEKFLELRNFTAKQYVNWIKGAPEFWKTIRPLTLEVKNKKKEIDSIYFKMDEYYPNFKAPNICFAISPIQSGGTTDKGLILIGTEIATVNPQKVEISEINGFMKKVFENSTGDIKSLVAHELVHTQQPNGDNENESLLSQAITEGSADFIATLLLEKQSMNAAIFRYGQKNEEKLWLEFKYDVETEKTFEETDWFYNYNSKRPADLGYYIGYKIAESYYENSDNKKEAIKDIINMNEPKEFLEKSSYDKSF
ncbi:DUF2268 domain-containing putative Zn-dependent protease [Christiangramia forsetii]|uniref:Secreted protein n=2 Tax=Christiangramia forsetii TaxID=411153 RepID=A0LZU9_CHRFK|nr:DUF2268 domain-containing putative Zn-dependent protease [Christiangramia forsetii]GGG46677.1 hypothetical protein GCM10011532_33250 [Christiangramia forsetii]CAL65894.1 secreted protein [Christiangramia forsetii KT0803]